MFVAYVVLAALLAAGLAMSAHGKLTRSEQVTPGLQKAGVPLSWFPPLAACEIAGAVGLVVGIWVPVLGIAAAIGVALYFVGAAVFHVRAKDVKGMNTPLVILALAVAVLVLRIIA